MQPEDIKKFMKLLSEYDSGQFDEEGEHLLFREDAIKSAISHFIVCEEPEEPEEPLSSEGIIHYQKNRVFTLCGKFIDNPDYPVTYTKGVVNVTCEMCLARL